MDEAVLDMLPFTMVELGPVRDAKGEIVDFIWTAANEAANRVVLPEGGSLVGLRVCEIDPAYQESDMFFDAVRCIETGQPRELYNSGRRPSLHGRLKHLQGTVVRYWILPKGEGCIIFSVEITDITRERDVARDSFEMFKAAFDHAVQAITLTTETSEIIYANPALYTLLGYAPGELEGKSSQVIMRDEDFEVVVKAGRKMWGGKIEQEINDLTLLTKDGQEIVISNALSSVYSEVRGEHIFISHGRDVRAERQIASKLKEAVSEAELATQLKSEFLANMSHEIRTPLNGILGMAQVLSNSELDPAQTEQVGIILDSGETLLSILNDILDLSKIEAGRLEMSDTEADLRSKLDPIRKLYETLAAEKGLNLKLFIDPSVPSRLVFDPLRVRQCFSNLLSNAVKFTETGDVLAVVTAEPGEDGMMTVTIHVSDTGCGIPAGKMERIFEPFAQADGSTTRTYGGTGLGLPITRKLARMMGGDVSVVSEPSRGSVFTLRFSARCAHARAAGPDLPEIAPIPRARTTPKTDFSALNRKKALIVDDSPINRRVARSFLEQHGMQISEAGDGLAALDKLNAEAFDLVLMDVHMPTLDGQRAFERLRAGNGPNAGIPVIALTADTMRGDREKYIAKGFSGYVSKPVNQDSLMAVITECLALPAANDDRRRRG